MKFEQIVLSCESELDVTESSLDAIVNLIRGGGLGKESDANKPNSAHSSARPAPDTKSSPNRSGPSPQQPRPDAASGPQRQGQQPIRPRPPEKPTNISAETSSASSFTKPSDSSARPMHPESKTQPPHALVPVQAVESDFKHLQELIGQGDISSLGELLTSPNSSLKIPDQSRQICALFDSGMFIVSESHSTSPLVTAVAAQARRAGRRVSAPILVTPDLVRKIYQLYDRERASKGDNNSVKRSIERVLQAAVDLNANDIHIEASEGRTKIQMRIDGTLRIWENWTQDEGERMLSAVFSYADVASGATANWNEPLAATLSPSTGEDKIRLPKFVGGIRCQWMPLAGGRYLNMRVNYDGGKMLGTSVESADMDSLGFNEEQLALVKHLRNVPGAMRVIAGPTNQGKTTTLRVMLNRRMFETDLKLNCLVIEDPPEGGIMGARQIGVSSSTDEKQRQRAFMEVLRASLRLDPDIIMLGEIRDFESATMAFRLALTGRQVYTSIHVYSALSIPQRIRDLGIEPYLVYDQNLLRGLMSQRLGRSMCKNCQIPWEKAVNIKPDWLESVRRARAALALMLLNRTQGFEKPDFSTLIEPDLSGICFPNPDGCEKNCYSGYKGRTVMVEIVETDAKLMGMLSKNLIEDAKLYWLSPEPEGQGGISMMWHGLEKIREGILSPPDVEFELGPLIRPQEMKQIESHIGEFKHG